MANSLLADAAAIATVCMCLIEIVQLLGSVRRHRGANARKLRKKR